MKFSIAQKCALFIGISASLGGAAVAADCDSVANKVRDAVSENPAKVLVIVDEQIAKNESCACEIVNAAIEGAGADKAMVREIVVTAVTAAQSQAATIAECAVAEAPEAAAEIKAGLSEVFAGAEHAGGKSVVYEDDYNAKGGKEVVEEEDFGPEPVVISGVYLIAPSAASSGVGALIAEDLEDDLKRAERLIEILRREVNEGRDSDRTSTTSPGPGPSPTDPVITDPVL